MASGHEWREYFEKKSTPVLKNQTRAINSALKSLDKKIISEFQLQYLQLVDDILLTIIRTRK